MRQLASALTRKWQLLQETQRYLTSLEERVRERTDTLQQSLSRLRATLESSTDGIVVVDTNKNVIDYNQKFLTMWDLLADEMTPEIKFDTILNKFKKSHIFFYNFLLK